MGIQIIIIVLILIVIFYFFGKNFAEKEESDSKGTVAEEIAEALTESNEKPQSEIIEVKAESIAEEKPQKESVVAVIVQSEGIGFLWKYGTESDWKKALNRYHELIPEDIRELDASLENLNANEIKNLSVEEFFMFLHDEYFVWKYTDKRHLAVTRKNLVKYVSEDKLSELSDIHKRLFEMDTDDIRKSFRTAGEIKGLSLSGASSLLSVLFPDKFGAIEKYTACALIEVSDKEEIVSIDPQNLKVKDAVLLEEMLREKAKELNQKFITDFWTPRKIDMVLYSIGE